MGKILRGWGGDGVNFFTVSFSTQNVCGIGVLVTSHYAVGLDHNSFSFFRMKVILVLL